METNRVEAFSDGVIAVIITIMVLELKPPHGSTLADAGELWPSLLIYALSFPIVAIMWVNHHHFLHRAKHADTRLFWSNNFLLFWMSLIPFVTAWLGESHGATLAVACYGGVLVMTSLGFALLMAALDNQDHTDTKRHLYFQRAKRKAVLSVALYAVAAACAFVAVRLSFAIFIIIPLLYFWPERHPSSDVSQIPQIKKERD